MEHEMTRREMIHASALLAGCICGCRTTSESGTTKSTCCVTPDLESESITFGKDAFTIDLKKARSLGETGNAAWITEEARSLKLIIVRAARDEYHVLSRLCTHGGQTVSYNRRRGFLQCNNFNHSIFDLTGRIVKGPAETPLASYPVRLVGDMLTVTLKEVKA